MSLKEYEYIRQTLERYTNSKLEDFCDHVLITNFRQYIKRFKEKIKGKSAEGNFRIVNAKERKQRILAIGMELATLFSVAYRYEVPIGSIMLVSDMPLQKKGIKDKRRHNKIYSEYMETHLDIGLDAAAKINSNWRTVARKLSSEW